jgi:hypothetical protein
VANRKVIGNVNVLDRFGPSNIIWTLAESILADGIFTVHAQRTVGHRACGG